MAASPPSPPASGFFSKLEKRCVETGATLCVGLDPHAVDLEAQTGEAAVKFCERIIKATSHVAVAYKPNAAFFEALGPSGITALKQVIASVPAGIPTLLDVKRGDIGSTCNAYAAAAYEHLGADAVTLSPYMGRESTAPFVADPSKGVFILCKTSNPSSADLQTLTLSGSDKEGEMLYERVARTAGDWSPHANVGLVVGATDAEALRRVRAAAPRLWLLAPGVGAQGGNLKEALRAGARAGDQLGVLVTVSRGISRAEDPGAAADGLVAAIKKELGAMRAEAAASASSSSSSSGLLPHQSAFVDMALKAQVLKFGSFTLKSGRESPYFFNAGLFNTGAHMKAVGDCYARTILKAGLEYDVIFGPAYKGITLATAIASSIFQMTGRDTPFAYNRKEKKDHGEGGVLVGAPVKGKRVLVVDDVITAGTAIREAMSILTAAEAKVVSVVVALDRQERGKVGTTSAVQEIGDVFGIPVLNVIGLDSLILYAQSKGDALPTEALPSIKAYRDKYGAELR